MGVKRIGFVTRLAAMVVAPLTPIVSKIAPASDEVIGGEAFQVVDRFGTYGDIVERPLTQNLLRQLATNSDVRHVALLARTADGPGWGYIGVAFP
jgi:hypothetical protein